MLVTVLRSNLKTKVEVERVSPLFDLHPAIIKWSVDYEDIDKVLRIESSENLSTKKLKKLLKVYGIEVEDLD